MKTLVMKGYEPDDPILKEYILEELPNCGFRILALPNTCFFCEKCADIFWDYSNGPYMFICDKEQITKEKLVIKGLIGKCKYFEVRCFESNISN